MIHLHRQVLGLAVPIALANLTQPLLSAVDTAIWRAGGDDDVDVAPGDRTVAVLPSADGGPRKLGSLAVLSRGGKPVELYGVQLQVLPNGSRWLAGYTRSGAFASLALRP